MAFMFKGPAALTGASTIITANATITGGTVNGVVIGGTITAAGSFTTLTASGNITTSAGDLVVSGASNKLHLQGGAGLQFGGSAELDAVATGGANNNIVPTRGYVDDAVANAGGTVATSTIVTGDSSKTLVNGTTYLISSAGGVVNCALVGSSLTNGGHVRFVVTDVTNSITLTFSTGLSGGALLVGAAVTGSITFDTIGHGLEFIFSGNKLHQLGGGFATSS